MWVQTACPNCQGILAPSDPMKKEGSASAGISSNQEITMILFKQKNPAWKQIWKKALTLVIEAESLEWKQQPSGLCDMGKPQCHGLWWGPMASGALLELGSATFYPVGTLSSYLQLPQSHSWALLEPTPWGTVSSWAWQEVLVGHQAHMWGYPGFLQQGCVDRASCTLRQGELTHPWPVRQVSVCTWHTLHQLQKVI